MTGPPVKYSYTTFSFWFLQDQTPPSNYITNWYSSKKREKQDYICNILFLSMLTRIKQINYIERERGRKEGMKRVNSPSLRSNISYLSVVMAITASTNRSVPAMAAFGNFYFIMRASTNSQICTQSRQALQFLFYYESHSK